MLLCPTRAFLLSAASVVLCAIRLTSIIWQLAIIGESDKTGIHYLDGDNSYAETNVRFFRRRKPDLPVSNRRNIPVHTIPVKRTFKGDGTCIWSEFLRYLRIFENKMAGMMIKNAKCFSQCYGTGRNLLIPSGTMRHQEQNP